MSFATLGPGPAGYQVRESTKAQLPRQPAFSMPRSKKDSKFLQAATRTPAPVEYGYPNYESIKANRAQHPIATRHERKAPIFETPGPGTYETDKAFANSLHRAQSFTKQLVHQTKYTDSPGPSDYDPLQSTIKTRNPAFTNRKKLQSSTLSKGLSPSPSTYELKVPNSFDSAQAYHGIAPGKTMSTRPLNHVSYDTPGPDSYEDNNKSTLDGPQFAFPKDNSHPKQDLTPGPGTYNPAHAQPKVIAKSLSASSLHNTTFRTNKNPGPSEYKPGLKAVSTQGRSGDIGKQKRFKKKTSTTPGPGAYMHEKKTKRAPSFSMAGRWREKPDPTGGPGPAPMDRSVDAKSYSNTLKDRKPAYTMRKKPIRSASTTRLSPGPADYFDHDKDNQTLRRAASASQLRTQRGLGFTGKPKGVGPAAVPGPAEYTPYATKSLGSTGNKATFKGRTAHPLAMTVSSYSAPVNPKRRTKKMVKKRRN